MNTAKNHNHKISVIVPAFKEKKLQENIRMIDRVLKDSFKNYEIICVEDGYDSHFPHKKISYRSKNIKMISYPLNVGKGFAFLYGFTQAKGDIIALLDSDLDIHPDHLRLYTDLLDLIGADIVIGSKRNALSIVHYPPIRRLYSRIFQILVRILFGLNVTDTQVGVKVFKREVLEKVLPRLVVKTWAFDLEILVVAHHLGFKKIVEAPVELKMRKLGSKIAVGSIKNFFQDMLAIYYRLNLLHYYDRTPASYRGKNPIILKNKKTTRLAAAQ
jgi:glycosyltransferase involved in cell wall biosynthesis